MFLPFYLPWRQIHGLRVAAHRLRNFLLMVAMHDYYYCILTGASPLLHKDKVPAKEPLTNFRANLEEISLLCSTFLERCGKLELRNLVHY